MPYVFRLFIFYLQSIVYLKSWISQKRLHTLPPLLATHKLHSHFIKEERGRIGGEGTRHGWSKALEPHLPVTAPGLSLQRPEALQSRPVGEVGLHAGFDNVLGVTGDPGSETGDSSGEEEFGG